MDFKRIRPAATFVNCVQNIKITQQFRWLGIPLTVSFRQGARVKAYNNGCGPLQWKVWKPLAENLLLLRDRLGRTAPPRS